MTNDDIKSAIAGKNILITGGTGSFGKQILLRLLEYSPATINIFSRDEKKQYEMRQSYLDHNELIFSLHHLKNYPKLMELRLKILEVLLNLPLFSLIFKEKGVNKICVLRKNKKRGKMATY